MATSVVASGAMVNATSVIYNISFVNNLPPVVPLDQRPADWIEPSLHKRLHGPAFSRPIVVSHDDTYHMWSDGSEASNGIALASLYGTFPDCPLLQEIQNNEPMDVGDVKIGNSFVVSKQDTGDGAVNDSQQTLPEGIALDSDHTFISVFFGIYPSPCWFSGFHDFQPVSVDDGTWYESFTIPVYPYTTGLACGNEDEADRIISKDSEEITRVTPQIVPISYSNMFLNEEGTKEVQPVAYIQFELFKPNQSPDNSISMPALRTNVVGPLSLFQLILSVFFILATVFILVLSCDGWKWVMIQRSQYKEVSDVPPELAYIRTLSM